jgi:hypothetical protein
MSLPRPDWILSTGICAVDGVLRRPWAQVVWFLVVFIAAWLAGSRIAHA